MRKIEVTEAYNKFGKYTEIFNKECLGKGRSFATDEYNIFNEYYLKESTLKYISDKYNIDKIQINKIVNRNRVAVINFTAFLNRVNRLFNEEEYNTLAEKFKNNPNYNIKLEDIELPIRDFNPIRRCGVNIIGDIVRLGPINIANNEYMNERVFKEVIKILIDNGFSDNINWNFEDFSYRRFYSYKSTAAYREEIKNLEKEEVKA